MAGTINYQLNVKDTYGTRQRRPVERAGEVAAAANPRQSGIVSIINTGQGEALPLGDVASPGLCWLRNTDATNFVQVGKDDGAGNLVPMLKLLPGADMLLYWDAAIVPRLKADTAPCEVEYELWSV